MSYVEHHHQIRGFQRPDTRAIEKQLKRISPEFSLTVRETTHPEKSPEEPRSFSLYLSAPAYCADPAPWAERVAKAGKIISAGVAALKGFSPA